MYNDVILNSWSSLFDALSSFGVSMFVSLCITGYLLYDLRKEARHRKELRELKWNFEKDVLQARVEMQEQTFQNISRDIHDNIGQKLSLVKMQVTMARKQGSAALEDTNELLTDVITDLREMSRSLCMDVIIKEGLIGAIRRDMHVIENNGLIEITMEINGESVFLDDNTELIIYRIFQEAIQNIIRHAQSSKIQIELLYSEESLVITITDNGQGIDPAAFPGNGLKNMEMRAKSLGGNLKIQSSSLGTAVSIALPIIKK